MNNDTPSRIRTSRFAFGLLALQACSDPAGYVPEASPTETPFPASAGEDLKSTLDSVVAAGVAPGVSLTVVHPSYRTWLGSSGVASLETREPLTPSSRFRAGSMMKPAVAAAVLQLVERGELSLDQNLTELLPPEIAARIPDAGAITLRMLLNHTSGIPEFSTPEFDAEVGHDPTRVWAFDELLDRALAVPAAFVPGGGWAYSNTDYILLGRILDEKTGKPWRATVRERVFALAELEHTELPEEGNAVCNGCARGYHPIDDALVDLTEADPSMAGAAGGGALISTPDDLARFMGALAAGRFFRDPATLDFMLDFVDAQNPEEAQTGYGLGLQRFHVADVDLVGHLGGTAGYQGFVFYHPGSGIVASGFMNTQGDFGAFIVPALEAITRVQ